MSGQKSTRIETRGTEQSLFMVMIPFPAKTKRLVLYCIQLGDKCVQNFHFSREVYRRIYCRKFSFTAAAKRDFQ